MIILFKTLNMLATFMLTCTMVLSSVPSLEELIQQGKEWEERTDLYVPSKETIEEYEDRVAKGETLEEYQNKKNSSSSTNSSTQTTPAHTHKWEATVTKEATCIEVGEVIKKCSCGVEVTERLKKIAHDYVLIETVDGNCSEIGYIVRNCAVCGLEEAVETEYGDHLFCPTEVVKETCETEGSMNQKCEVCGVENYEIIPALGHLFTEAKVVVKEATCEEEGIKAYVCQNAGCELIEEEETVPATGHGNEKVITIDAPTFFKNGYEETVCGNCGEVLVQNYLPATGGVFRYVTVGGIVAVLLGGISVVIYLMKKRKE